MQEAYAKAGREHAGGDHEVGQDEAGHAEGEEDRLPGIWPLKR